MSDEAKLPPTTSEYASYADFTVEPMVEQITCDDRRDCTYWRGGIMITDTIRLVDGVGNWCTWGFIGRTNAGNLKMLSAAHCDHAHGYTTWYEGADYTSDGLTIGLADNYYDGGIYDSMRVNAAGQTGAPYNRIYFSELNKVYAINGVETWDQQANGDLVNMTGHVSLTKANREILNNDFNWINGVTWFNGVKVDGQMDNGDSGGPAYYLGKGDGLLSVKGSGFTAYVDLWQNAEHLNFAYICSTDNCP